MKNTNKKGMTLVEVIISMCILAAIAGMFITIAVAAKKKNADTAQRSREMYEQAAAAESFNTSVKYDTDTIKVSKLLTNGPSNSVKISADFGTIKLETNASAYKVTRRGKDGNDKDYNLRFFRSDNVNIATPDPSTGKYWVKVFNHTGMSLDVTYLANDGTFFDLKESPLTNPGVVIPNETCSQLGYQVGSSAELFKLVDYNDNSITFGSGSFTKESIEKFMEKVNGNKTGIIIIHICDGLELKSQEEYEEG